MIQIETNAGMWEQHVYYEWKPKYCNECLRYGHTRIKIRGMVIQGEVEKKLQVPKQVWQVVVQKGKPPIEREGRKWENLANVSKVAIKIVSIIMPTTSISALPY